MPKPDGASIQDIQTFQATMQRTLGYWIEYLTARRLQVIERLRTKGQMVTTPETTNPGGLHDIDGL